MSDEFGDRVQKAQQHGRVLAAKFEVATPEERATMLDHVGELLPFLSADAKGDLLRMAPAMATHQITQLSMACSKAEREVLVTSLPADLELAWIHGLEVDRGLDWQCGEQGCFDAEDDPRVWAGSTNYVINRRLCDEERVQLCGKQMCIPSVEEARKRMCKLTYSTGSDGRLAARRDMRHTRRIVHVPRTAEAEEETRWMWRDSFESTVRTQCVENPSAESAGILHALDSVKDAGGLTISQKNTVFHWLAFDRRFDFEAVDCALTAKLYYREFYSDMRLYAPETYEAARMQIAKHNRANPDSKLKLGKSLDDKARFFREAERGRGAQQARREQAAAMAEVQRVAQLSRQDLARENAATYATILDNLPAHRVVLYKQAEDGASRMAFRAVHGAMDPGLFVDLPGVTVMPNHTLSWRFYDPESAFQRELMRVGVPKPRFSWADVPPGQDSRKHMRDCQNLWNALVPGFVKPNGTQCLKSLTKDSQEFKLFMDGQLSGHAPAKGEERRFDDWVGETLERFQVETGVCFDEGLLGEAKLRRGVQVEAGVCFDDGLLHAAKKRCVVEPRLGNARSRINFFTEAAHVLRKHRLAQPARPPPPTQ